MGATVEAPQGAGQFHDLGQVQYPEAQAGATARAGATTTGPKTNSTIPMAAATRCTRWLALKGRRGEAVGKVGPMAAGAT